MIINLSDIFRCFLKGEYAHFSMREEDELVGEGTSVTLDRERPGTGDRVIFEALCGLSIPSNCTDT